MVPLTVSALLAEIPPFFEPGAPPPTLPILLAQTEVGSVISLPKLLVEEEIGTGPILMHSLVKSHPAPYWKHSTAGPPLNSYPTVVVLDTESRDRDYDDSDQDLESSDDGTLIPKPNGKAGWPGWVVITWRIHWDGTQRSTRDSRYTLFYLFKILHCY